MGHNVAFTDQTKQLAGSRLYRISTATFQRLSLRYSPNLTKTLDFPSSLSQGEYSRGVLLMYGFIRVDACKMSSGDKDDILQLVTGVTRAQK